MCSNSATVIYNVTIKWYHNGAVQIKGVRQTTKTNNLEGTDTYQSILSLTDPQPASDSGEYYCQATADGVDLLPSELFILSIDNFAYINFVECINTNVYLSTTTKCADRHDATSSPPTIHPTLCTGTETSTLAIPQTLTANDLSTFEVIQTLSPTDNAGASTQTDTASVPNKLNYTLASVSVATVVFCVIIALSFGFICIYQLRRKTQNQGECYKKESCLGPDILAHNSFFSISLDHALYFFQGIPIILNTWHDR